MILVLHITAVLRNELGGVIACAVDSAIRGAVGPSVNGAIDDAMVYSSVGITVR